MKYKIGLFVAILVVGVLSFGKAQAVDICNQVFTYEKTGDYTDTRVDIDFESSNQRIDVGAGAGYQVTEVSLDVDNDGFSGYHVYATGELNNFNPNPGNEINKVKVKVKKVCPSPSPSVEPSPTVEPSPSVEPIPTVTPEESPVVTGDDQGGTDQGPGGDCEKSTDLGACGADHKNSVFAFGKWIPYILTCRPNDGHNWLKFWFCDLRL